MNIKNLFRTTLLVILVFSTSNSTMAQSNTNIATVQNYVNYLSEISKKYESYNNKSRETVLYSSKNENKDIIDSNISSKISKCIKYIKQSSESLRKNTFTRNDNGRLISCIQIINDINNELQPMKKLNKKQYNELYNDLNKLMKICKNLQKIGEKNRVKLTKNDLQDNSLKYLINKFEERLRYLKNNKEFMTSEAKNLVFFGDNKSSFLNMIEELKYNINSFPSIIHDISIYNTDPFIEYFSKKGEDLAEILDSAEYWC